MSSQWNLPGLRGSLGAKNSVLYQGGESFSVTILPPSKNGSMEEETDYHMDSSYTDAPGPSCDVEYTHYIGVSGPSLFSNVYNDQREDITVASGTLACFPLSRNPPIWRGDQRGEPSQHPLQQDDQGFYDLNRLASDTRPAYDIYRAIDLYLNGVMNVHRDDFAKCQKEQELTALSMTSEIQTYLEALPRSVIHVCCSFPFYSSPYRERKDIALYIVAHYFRPPSTMSLTDQWNIQIRYVRIQEHYPWYLPLPNGNTASHSSDQVRRLVAPAEQTNVYSPGSIPKSADADTEIDDSSSSSEFTVSDTEEDDESDSLNDDIQSFDPEPVEDHSGACPETESIAAVASNNSGGSSSMAISKSKDYEPPCLDPATCDPSTHPTPAGTTKPKPKPKVTKPRLTRATKTRRTRTPNPLAPGTTQPAKLVRKGFPCTHLGCTLEYQTNYGMEVHRRKKHEGVKFPCKLCTKVLSSYNVFTRHLNREHKGQSWVCAPCGNSRSRKPSPKALQKLGSCPGTGSGGCHDFQLFPGPDALSTP